MSFITSKPIIDVLQATPRLYALLLAAKLQTSRSRGYPMFSGEDLLSLRQYYIAGKASNPNMNYDRAFSIIVTELGVFAIHIKDLGRFQLMINQRDSKSLERIVSRELNRAYERNSFFNRNSSNDYMKSFLKVISKLSSNISGISLYKLND